MDPVRLRARVPASSRRPSTRHSSSPCGASCTTSRTSGASTNAGLQGLIDAGADVSDDEVTKRREAVSIDDVASIIYTSGTTGRPKGCQLTHRSFISEVAELRDGLDELLQRHDLDAAVPADRPRLRPRHRDRRAGLRVARSATPPTSRTCSTTWPSSSRRSSWRSPASSRRSTTPPSSAPTAAARAGSSIWPSRSRSSYSRSHRRRQARVASAEAAARRVRPARVRHVCAPRSAATASPPCPAARRWARGSATSSAASASRSTRATASPRRRPASR